jgi:uncharacterized membrane protein
MFPGGNVMWMAIAWCIGLAVFAVLFWALLAVFSVFSAPRAETREEELNRRLASGEIGLDEYTKKSAALSRTKRAA